MNPTAYAKAIVGGVLAGLAMLGGALVDDVVTAAEWVGVAVATLTVFSGVFGIPNAAKKELVTQHVMTVTKQDMTPVDAVEDLEAPKPVDGL